MVSKYIYFFINAKLTYQWLGLSCLSSPIGRVLIPTQTMLDFNNIAWETRIETLVSNYYHTTRMISDKTNDNGGEDNKKERWGGNSPHTKVIKRGKLNQSKLYRP